MPGGAATALWRGDSPVLGLLAAYERTKDDYVFTGRRGDLYYASAHNMAVRRTVLEELGGFAERRRGSDTLLARRVAQARPDAVRYVPEMVVRHLEIAGVRDYYRKTFAYGRSMRSLNGAGRQLRSAERLTVWRRTVQRERYGAARAAALLAALSGAIVCWGLGSLAGIAREPG